MLSEKRHTTRSPSESVRTESVRTGPTTGASERLSRRSSITEEDESSNIPPAPPLLSAVRSKAKSSSSSSSSADSTTPTLTPSKVTTNDTKAAKTSNDASFPRSTLRHVSSDEKNSYGRRTANETSKSSDPKGTTSGKYNRVNVRDLTNDKPSTTYTSYGRGDKTSQSIFEKVDTHNGHTTYLGTGTFSQLESCIKDCMSHKRSHADLTDHLAKSNFPHKSGTRASVLDDYSYDGISAPKHQERLSDNSHHHIDHHHYSDHHHHSDRHHHHQQQQYHSDHRKAAAELSLTEIREVNDALAQYGIPVFSHHSNPHNPHQRTHSVNEIVSACRLLMNEPRLGLNNDGTHAVEHAWDAIQHHSPHTNIHGYSSPALRSVASHLFHPNQTPYDPVHGVASHLFGQPQQNSYNPTQGGAPNSFGPPQQNSFNPGQSAISRLFSGPSSGPPPPPQQQQPQTGGSPFSNNFHQYPGNTNYMY